MSEIVSRKAIKDALNCALSSNSDLHLLEDPVRLDCNHCVCKQCKLANTNNNIITCNICKQLNECNLNDSIETNAFNDVIETHLSDVFAFLYEELSKKLNHFNDMESISEDILDVRLNFVRESIEIRIESIKIELEKLNESFNQQLNEIKDNWKKQSEINLKLIKSSIIIDDNELEDLKSQISKNDVGLNQDIIYNYTKKLNELNKCITANENNIPNVEFKSSTYKIEQYFIGEIELYSKSLELMNKEILKRAEENHFETILLSKVVQPRDLCFLPNDVLIVTDMSLRKLYLYNSQNFEYIKDIDSINGKRYNVICLDTNHKNAIYLSAHNEHTILKLDFDFNESAIFGGEAGSGCKLLSHPHGICYSDGYVYVSDYTNKRIVKLDENLVFQAANIVSFAPTNIRITRNVACVRACFSASSLYFFDISNFSNLTLICKYEKHSGAIGASELYFYEYDWYDKKLYCFNNKGQIIEKIQTCLDGKNRSFGGSIYITKSNLLIFRETNLLVKI